MSLLILNQRRKWVDLPGQAGVKLLLSPLPASRRTVLTEQCMVQPPKPAKGEPRKPEYFDHDLYRNLVGAECVHGWEGMGNVVDDAGTVADLPYSADLRPQLMEIDPVAAFILQTVTGLGIHLAEETKKAGNDSAGPLAG